MLITRKSALGTGPVSASYLAGYLGRHERGISLEHIRRDRILAEALATGADPLHLAWSSAASTTPTRWPTPAPPATFSAAPSLKTRVSTEDTHGDTPDPSQSPCWHLPGCDLRRSRYA